jgi:hypothetical protein
VNLNENLIYVFEVFQGEIFEPEPFPPFTVDFESDVLTGKIMARQHSLKTEESMFACLLVTLTNASQGEVTCITGLAYRNCGIDAVVLVVHHRKFRC